MLAREGLQELVWLEKGQGCDQRGVSSCMKKPMMALVPHVCHLFSLWFLHILKALSELEQPYLHLPECSVLRNFQKSMEPFFAWQSHSIWIAPLPFLFIYFLRHQLKLIYQE